MKLTKRQTDDLLVMIQHSKIDMSYGGGGTFNNGEDKYGDFIYDEKDAKKVERAIGFIKQLIILK